MRPMRWIAAALLMLPASASAAAVVMPEAPGPDIEPRVQAVRTATPPEIDGKLDDPVWQQAHVFRRFVQSFPEQNGAPSERTEARVLYDDRHLYVGVKCFDSKPETILRTLGRRDNPPYSDTVAIAIDSLHDRRTAYTFIVTAGGVRQDGVYFNDNRFSADWDAVWDSELAVQDDGWSVELAIPLSVLRFTAGREQVWGFHLRREIPRMHETIESAFIPRTGNELVSRFITLTGLRDLKPRRTLELTPYTAARASLAPRHDEAGRPEPRLFNPSADLGLDLRTALTSDLVLNATVNPDFGQVEADRVVLNLGTTELFFPEKRPFFTQGLELFVPVGADEQGRAPHMLFYSRRIGLETPILGAAKLVGRTDENLEVGVLDAVVAGAANPSWVGPDGVNATADDAPDRSFRFHPGRPLHFGLNNELPRERPVTQNFFAAAARRRVFGGSRVGARFTDVTPLSKECYREDFASRAEYEATDCEPVGQRAIAADWDVRTDDQTWGVFGQVAGSQFNGRFQPFTLRDGTKVAPLDTGLGAYVRAGKLGGDPIRAFAQYQYTSPKFDLNSAGFVQTQNLQSLWGEVRYVRPGETGFLRDLSVGAYGVRDWTTDAQALNRGNAAGLFVNATLPAFVGVWSECGWEYGGFDPREIERAGVPYEKAPSVFCGGGLSSDSSKAVFASANAFAYQNLPAPNLVARRGYSGDVTLTIRPAPRVETQLSVSGEQPALTADFLDRVDGDTFRFGALVAQQLSVTLRQQVVITPELTLQGYAQLFGAAGHFGPFYEADFAGRPIRMTDLRPGEELPAEYDFRESALNLNVVLRWEYAPGSTLYAVYSRSQENLPQSGDASGGLTLRGLGAGPTRDTLLVKWSYYWDVGI